MTYSELVAAKKMVRERVKKYGLQSQRNSPYFKSQQMLNENGFVLSERNRNCLFTNGGSETMKHWIVKSMVFKKLREMGRQVGTEVEVNGGIVDVLDLDNMIAYEVENNFTRKKLNAKLSSLSGLRDIFFIDIVEVPDTFDEATIYLGEKLV